jgi:hypothetical protein
MVLDMDETTQADADGNVCPTCIGREMIHQAMGYGPMIPCPTCVSGSASAAEEMEAAWDAQAEIARLNEALDFVAAEREAWKLRAHEDNAALVRVRKVADVWRTDAQRSTQTESGYTVRGQACRDAADAVFAALQGDDT